MVLEITNPIKYFYMAVVIIKIINLSHYSNNEMLFKEDSGVIVSKTKIS